MSTPPIPLRLAGRPTVGGLVVPAVSVVAAGRPVLGAVHHSKAMRCITDYLCQACDQLLTWPIVVIVSNSGLEQCYSSEAALHPECAHYSTRACPFLNGHRDAYRTPDRHIGEGCDIPGCDCGGWSFTDADRDADRRGELAERWWSVWLNQPYAVAVNDRREVHGLSWRDIEPAKVRLVREAAPR